VQHTKGYLKTNKDFQVAFNLAAIYSLNNDFFIPSSAPQPARQVKPTRYENEAFQP